MTGQNELAMALCQALTRRLLLWLQDFFGGPTGRALMHCSEHSSLLKHTCVHAVQRLDKNAQRLLKFDVMSEATVRSFFVTLKRSYAGTPWFHQRILRALGLKRRHLCVEKPNNISIRGMLHKVGLSPAPTCISRQIADSSTHPFVPAPLQTFQVRDRSMHVTLPLAHVLSWRSCVTGWYH